MNAIYQNAAKEQLAGGRKAAETLRSYGYGKSHYSESLHNRYRERIDPTGAFYTKSNKREKGIPRQILHRVR